MIDESSVDPPNIEIQLVNRILHPQGFETVQFGYLLVLLNHAFHKQLFRTVNFTLGATNFKD